MKAFLKGLSVPGAWDTEPMSVDFGSFMSSLTRTFSSSMATPKYVGQNLAVLSKEYVNINLRLGYHFNMIVAYISENLNDNYAYFRFLGGVTDMVRLTSNDLMAELPPDTALVDGMAELTVQRPSLDLREPEHRTALGLVAGREGLAQGGVVLVDLDLVAVLGSPHLTHPEHDRDLDVLALVEELARLPGLGFEIVNVDVGPVLDLFDLDLMLLLLRLARLLLLLEAEAPIIHDLADDGAGVRGHLDQVEPLLPGHVEGLVDGHDADLLAVGADEADRRKPNSFIDAHLGCIWIFSKRELADDLPPLSSGCPNSRPTFRPG